MKIGVNLKINVSNILKEHLFQGKKGKYLDATVFIDVDNKGQHGDNGMVTQSWKDAIKGQTPILGNATVFWRDDGAQGQQQNNQGQQSQSQGPQGGYNQQQANPKQQNQNGMNEPDFDFDDKPPF